MTTTLAGSLALAATWQATAQSQPERPPAETPLKSKKVSPEERVDALSRASVWTAPPPIAKARFGPDPRQPREVSCTFEITQLGGTAPKFDCRLPSGERIRVKYGNSPEIHSEVASATLLTALGFSADDVTLVEKLRCYGCPSEPFLTMKTLGLAGAEQLYGKVMDTKEFKDFTWVTVERRHHGRAIETEDLEGWAFFELDLIDPNKGGAPRAHVDALRLLAVLMAHWDNKSENQRLVCLSDRDWSEEGKCAKPMAMLQDVGSGWGPRKVDLEKWRATPIWADRATCTATMDSLPYQGATFKPVQISEAGRQHVGRLLRQLSAEQMTALFRYARFDEHSPGLLGTPSSIAEWVAAFQAKVRDITEGPACPQ